MAAPNDIAARRLSDVVADPMATKPAMMLQGPRAVE